MSTSPENHTIRFVLHCCICGRGLHGEGELFPVGDGYKPAHVACYQQATQDQPRQMSFAELQDE